MMRGSPKFRIPISEHEPPPVTRVCDHPGCLDAGAYRAPKARDRLNDYFWFCLDHVKDYNRSWNYCAGLSDLEVERLIRLDTVWQRPTWKLGGWGVHDARLRETLYRQHGLGEGEEPRAAPERPRRPQPEEEQALSALDLDASVLGPPVDFPAIKTRYRHLVKQHHPDANQGSREAEERLKAINLAFSVLRARYDG